MLPASDCDIPTSACCEALFDIGEHLLTSVFLALGDCWPNDDSCGGLLAYMTMGEGDDGVVDSLTVDFVQANTLAVSVRDGVMLANARSQAVYAVRLRESGWPVVHRGDATIDAPDPLIQNALARHVYAHGEVMHRKLTHMARTRTLTPSVVGCMGGLISALTPLRPRGGVVGWQVEVTVGLPW